MGRMENYRKKMKSLIISILLVSSLAGCATANKDYVINGVEPGPNQGLKVLGGILLLGIIGKAASGSSKCNKTIIRDNSGVMIGTTGSC